VNKTALFAATILAASTPLFAHAADIVVSAAPITDYLQPAVDAMKAGLVAALSAWLIKHVRNQLLRAALQKAIVSAGAGVYSALVIGGKTLLDGGLVEGAVASKTNALIAAFPDTMKTLGVTPADLHNAVANAFGLHLAADPTVTLPKVVATKPATANADTTNTTPATTVSGGTVAVS
jgi:hypothetical protein